MTTIRISMQWTTMDHKVYEPAYMCLMEMMDVKDGNGNGREIFVSLWFSWRTHSAARGRYRLVTN